MSTKLISIYGFVFCCAALSGIGNHASADWSTPGYPLGTTGSGVVSSAATRSPVNPDAQKSRINSSAGATARANNDQAAVARAVAASYASGYAISFPIKNKTAASGPAVTPEKEFVDFINAIRGRD